LNTKTITGGMLYVVGTPIGNLDDITVRAVATLEHCDAVAAEDTRRTRKLLTHLGLSRPIIAYHDHNADKAVPMIIERIEQGEAIALVTDGGMPVISDPGYTLISKCHDSGIPVAVIPGPSAVVAALAVAGLRTERFCFEGYLPRKKSERRTRWNQIAKESRAVVIYEAPHRMHLFLNEIKEFIPNRIVCICREMTKIYEETIRGKAADIAGQLLDETGRTSLKGEITIVIDSNTGTEPVLSQSELDSAIRKAFASRNDTHRNIAHTVADTYDIPFRKVYRRLLELMKSKSL
jgi:16S rRNA (cytidine1402-2'-O)-methyltransferase